jgi:beta-N-acetylhexosaminidase
MRIAAGVVLILFFFSTLSPAENQYQKPGPVKLTDDGRRWVERTLKKLSLEEKVGQMLNIRYFTDFNNFNSDDYKNFRAQLQKYNIGSVVLTVHVDGPMLLMNPPLEVATVANQLQRDSKLPLLIAADFERGPASRVSFVPAFPDAMAFGAIGKSEYAERFGAITAEESRAMGVQWDLFPVADVNSNPQNPIINTRSFGEDPAQVGNLVAAFIKGAREHGMLTTAKHFPGHGDTGTDSHLGVAKVQGDMAHLEAIELPPFKKAIEAGVDSVLTAHVSVPALEPDPNKVATISGNVISNVLRKQLGFNGVVITDALDMRGLTSIYPPSQGSPTARAAVDAVKAGNDVILWPTDLEGAFNSIVSAVRNGDIPQARIDDSVRKILEMKAAVGLHQSRLVNLEQIPWIVDRPEDLAFAQQVADEAVTLVRNNRQVIPISKIHYFENTNSASPPAAPPDAGLVTIIFADTVRGDWGRAFEKLLHTRADATVFYVDNSVATALSPEILQAVQKASKVVVAAYIVPVAAKQVMVNGKLENSVGLEQSTGELLRRILEMAAPKTAVVAMGNPYLIQNFPEIQTYVCTYSNARTSELSAVKVLFGELEAKGKLPVRLEK